MLGKCIDLFKLMGFEVKIDLSWSILAIIAWSLSAGRIPFRYEGLSSQTYWIMGIVGTIGFFFSIVVHELSHSLVARQFGMPIKGIALFLFLRGCGDEKGASEPQGGNHDGHCRTGSSRLMVTEGNRLAGIISLKGFYKVLSPETIYFRLFRHVKKLPPPMLARFTQIEYDREIALVALNEDSSNERILGVARIMGDPDGKQGEFAVVVGDSSHGKGIGSNLLGKCLEIAEKRGFQKVYGFVLRENESMLALGKNWAFR